MDAHIRERSLLEKDLRAADVGGDAGAKERCAAKVQIQRLGQLGEKRLAASQDNRVHEEPVFVDESGCGQALRTAVRKAMPCWVDSSANSEVARIAAASSAMAKTEWV